MSKLHKSLWVLSRQSAIKEGKESDYVICYCEYGKDHDDTRSITAQDDNLVSGFGGMTNDMLSVARRGGWNFTPEGVKYIKDWIHTSGEYRDGKLQPKPFADEISELISTAPTKAKGE